MARPKADPLSVATPERILDAATVVFATRGFERATLADIAERAGLRRPSLLYHFDRKETLYNAVVEQTFARLGAALQQPMGSPLPFVSALEAMVRTYTSFLAEHPLEARLIARELLEEDGPGTEILRAQVAPLLGAVVTYIETEGRGQLREDLPVQAAVVQLVMDGLMQAAMGPLRELFWGPPSIERAWQLCATLLLKDLPANPPQGDPWAR